MSRLNGSQSPQTLSPSTDNRATRGFRDSTGGSEGEDTAHLVSPGGRETGRYDWAEGRAPMCAYFTLLLVRKSLKHGPFRSQLFPGSQMGRGLVSCKVSQSETKLTSTWFAPHRV